MSVRTSTLAKSVVVAAVAASTVFAASACSSNGSQPVPGGATPQSDIKFATLQPNDGFTPVADYMNTAKKTIDIVMYETDLPFPQLMTTLEAAVKRGVKVRLLLSSKLYQIPGKPPVPNHNVPDLEAYRKIGVDAQLSRPEFSNEHQKTIQLDAGTPEQRVMVCDFNLGASYFSDKSPYPGEGGTRGMSLIDTNKADNDTIAAYYNADWPPYSAWPVSTQANLVWAPSGPNWSPQGNAQTVLTSMFNNAQKNLDVYAQMIPKDAILLQPLVDAAKRGVKVRVVGNKGGIDPVALDQLKGAGAQVVVGPKMTASDPNPLYVHTKTIIADAEGPTAVAFVGSENPFLDDSILNERELGLLTTESANVSKIESTFNSDFSTGTPQ